MLKHPSIGARGQVLKSSKVKLDEEIPVPYFLADPSHHMKNVAKHIFSIVNYVKAHRCRFTKAYSIILKNDWGYMIKKSGTNFFEELRQESKVFLGHMSNNYGKYSA